MDSGEDPLPPKPPVSGPLSDPVPAGLVYGFQVNPPPPPLPAPESPPALKDRAPGRGNHGGPVSTRPDDAAGVGARTTARAVELWRNARNAARAVKSRCDGGMCFAALMLLALLATIVFAVYRVMILLTSDSSLGLFVSGVHLSSFGVSPSSRQLNGTWHIDFQLLYKDPSGDHLSCHGAAVSVYYKGTYLAEANLHAFIVTPERPIRLAVNVDAYQSHVPGWLTDDLAEDSRLGVAAFAVQFITEFQVPYHEAIQPRTFLCGGLRLGFSTTEEAKLVGDGDVGCPKVAW